MSERAAIACCAWPHDRAATWSCGHGKHRGAQLGILSDGREGYYCPRCGMVYDGEGLTVGALQVTKPTASRNLWAWCKQWADHARQPPAPGAPPDA
jgi:hypothetical protein